MRFSATINGEVKDFGSLSNKLLALEAAWRVSQKPDEPYNYNHIAYLQIIGGGAPMLWLLMERVHRGENVWFPAIKAIAGHDPSGGAEDIEALRTAWINWAFAIWADQADPYRHRKDPPNA